MKNSCHDVSYPSLLRQGLILQQHEISFKSLSFNISQNLVTDNKYCFSVLGATFILWHLIYTVISVWHFIFRITMITFVGWFVIIKITFAVKIIFNVHLIWFRLYLLQLISLFSSYFFSDIVLSKLWFEWIFLYSNLYLIKLSK